jgi:hypothetical protein
MTDTLKERDFAYCDCPMGKYSLHCTEEQKNQILKNQSVTSVISGIAESEGIKIYELITKYETLQQKEKLNPNRSPITLSNKEESNHV